MTLTRGSAEGVGTEVVASRFRVDPGFPFADHVT